MGRAVTDLDECIHGLGPVTACTICNGRDAREQAERDRVLYTFTAAFDGPVACGHRVERGEQLARLVDDRIVCTACTP